MEAYVFPGQGSQYPGMGYDLYKHSEKVRRIFDTANNILGFNITDVIFAGTKEELRSTEISQLAIFICSFATVKALNSFQPQGVAGHSLGEYSALASVNAIDFKDCLRLIKKRADAMKEASLVKPGKMIAVLGLEDEKVEKICKNYNNVFPANYNCPGQIVISGDVLEINKILQRLTAEAKKVVELNVSGPFHTRLMNSAKKKLEKEFDYVKIKEPICPIYQNIDGKPSQDPKVIKQKLVNQMISPVRWTQTIHNMVKDGFCQFREIGPGDILKGLISRIDSSVEVSTVKVNAGNLA